LDCGDVVSIAGFLELCGCGDGGPEGIGVGAVTGVGLAGLLELGGTGWGSCNGEPVIRGGFDGELEETVCGLIDPGVSGLAEALGEREGRGLCPGDAAGEDDGLLAGCGVPRDGWGGAGWVVVGGSDGDGVHGPGEDGGESGLGEDRGGRVGAMVGFLQQVAYEFRQFLQSVSLSPFSASSPAILHEDPHGVVALIVHCRIRRGRVERELHIVRACTCTQDGPFGVCHLLGVETPRKA
jgi:hypothetical protein